MAKLITWDYLTTETIEVYIPVTKRHSVKLIIKDHWVDPKMGIYPVSLDIFCGEKMVTDLYVERNVGDDIKPTAMNLKTAIELIEEAEYRMKERRDDGRTTEEE
jgi:hypothetical protein